MMRTYGIEPDLSGLRRELAIRSPTPNDVDSHLVTSKVD
jgi:hypothetical protein